MCGRCRGNGKAPCDWLDESEGLVSRLRLVRQGLTSPRLCGGRGRRAAGRRERLSSGRRPLTPTPLPHKAGEREKDARRAREEAADRLPIPARDVERLARDPRRIVRGEIDDCGCDVARLADPTERRLRLDLLAEVALGDARRVDALRLHHAGVDRVDADLQVAPVRSRAIASRHPPPLGAAIDRGVGQPARSRPPS